MRDIDQELAHIRDKMPRVWWSLYQGCLQTGFDESQSFALLTTFVLGSSSGGIHPIGGGGPNSDEECQ